MVQAQLIRRGSLLEYLTLGWNVVLMTEGHVTLIDAYLAGAVLIGLILNALFGWWWADPLASLAIVYYGFREGLHAWRGEEVQHE